MGRIGRIKLLIELPSIEAKDKQTQGTFERIGTARETTRRSGQTRQVMAQFSIVAFHREGIGFAFRNFIPAKVIPKAVISIKSVAVIAFGLRSSIHHLLDSLLCAFLDYFPPHITARLPVYTRDDVDPVFLLPIKVNNSSISASFTSSGIGASGKLTARALTHHEMVRWWMPSWRPILRKFIPSI